MEQAAAGGEKAVFAERWPAKPLPPGGREDEVMDGTTIVRAIQAGWRIYSIRTMGQAANSSTSEKWGEDFADVFHSVMENGPKVPMIPSDKMMQLQTKMQSHLLTVHIHQRWTDTRLCEPTGMFPHLLLPEVERMGAISQKSSKYVRKSPFSLHNQTELFEFVDWTCCPVLLSFDGRAKTQMLSWFN